MRQSIIDPLHLMIVCNLHFEGIAGQRLQGNKDQCCLSHILISCSPLRRCKSLDSLCLLHQVIEKRLVGHHNDRLEWLYDGRYQEG
jgi:hypothetical protein